MAVETLALDKIEPNPYRNFVLHPFRTGQVELLRASIGLTTFWEGLIARPHPDRRGRYQLAFGHARWQAAVDEGIKRADFIIRDFDDDAMLRSMADENVTQFGRDEYATYREVVIPAAERIMTWALTEPTVSRYGRLFERKDDCQRCTYEIRAGGAPGSIAVGRYFGGTLSDPAIRMALKEYRDSGKLAEWHAKHNPQATKEIKAATLNSEALGKFESIRHVRAFAEECERLGVPPSEQVKLAGQVINALKDPPAKDDGKTAIARKRNVDWQRTEKAPHERLTSVNIRRVVTETIGKSALSAKDRRRLEAEAHALSIERALTEIAIGVGRAAKAAGDLVGVARAIGGMTVDMNPISRKHLQKIIADYEAIGVSMREAAKAGPNTGLRRLT